MFIYGKRSIDRNYTVVEWGETETFEEAANEMILHAKQELLDYFNDKNLLTTEQFTNITSQVELLEQSIMAPGVYRLRTRFPEGLGGKQFYSSLFIKEVIRR